MLTRLPVDRIIRGNVSITWIIQTLKNRLTRMIRRNIVVKMCTNYHCEKSWNNLEFLFFLNKKKYYTLPFGE